MGMTIDEALKELKDYEYYAPYQELISFVSDWIEQFKADYETRLKADMATMLEELYMEIEELDTPSDDDSYDAGIVDCEKLIQQKINSLKENSDVC